MFLSHVIYTLLAVTYSNSAFPFFFGREIQIFGEVYCSRRQVIWKQQSSQNITGKSCPRKAVAAKKHCYSFQLNFRWCHVGKSSVRNQA